MNKKLVGIIIASLLISSTIAAGNITKTTSNVNKTESQNAFDDECNYCISNNIDYIYPNKLSRRPQTLEQDTDSLKITIRNDLPEYFSWKDYKGMDFTTPAKDQFYPLPCGSCFIYAAVGALENVIKIREGSAELSIDLSEQYVLSCLSDFRCDVGSFGYLAYKYINDTGNEGNNCNGIIPEFCYPYRGVDRNGNSWGESGYPPALCEDKCENWEEFLIPITKYEHFWLSNFNEEELFDTIKTLIMEKGPLDVGIVHTWDWHKWAFVHNNPNDYYPYPGPINQEIDHEVVLLGWKDDPSIGNGGYWICKNSYGTEWGYDGFFNIEYGTNLIDSYLYNDVGWAEYDPDSFKNWLPTIMLSGSYYGNTGEAVTFDASDSFDHEGTIISYEWDFGDDKTGTGATITHTYSDPGVYLVNLILTDDDGNIANDTTWAFIDRINSAPNPPIISGETQGRKRKTYDYTFSSLDPEGDEVYYYIFWGGFNWEGWYGPYVSEEEAVYSHMWAKDETYIIHAKSKDKYGAESGWTTLEVSMPKNKFNGAHLFLQRFIQRFPLFEKILK